MDTIRNDKKISDVETETEMKRSEIFHSKL